MKNQWKELIEDALTKGEIEKAINILDVNGYASDADRDVKVYKCIIYLQMGDYDRALKEAEYLVKKHPTSYEVRYYQGSVYQEMGNVIGALKSYRISLFLMEYFRIDNQSMREDVINQIDYLEKQLEEDANIFIEKQDIVNIKKIDCYINRLKSMWGLWEKAPRDPEKMVVGTEYWVSDNDLRYIGIYRAPLPQHIGEKNLSLVRTQAEFLPFVRKGNDFQVSGEGEEYLVPVASLQSNMHTFITEKNEETVVAQQYPRHFNYYRVKNNTQIASLYTSYFGKPIPLEHHDDRKKLVLSFFVDGLAQEVINGDDFKKLMPNTYHFFKKGTVCTQAYSCSEWTFPSLATYESGLNTLNHMMFHNTLDGELPLDVPTLSEYFKSKGYYTSKLDGDWRCIYSYGFARGVDQYIYHHQSMGARAEQEIINIIEHLETFKETDHYLWMTVGDLHDIADGLDLSLAVQKNLSLEEREYEEKGATSVKQNYSAKKTAMYKKTIQYFDMLFGILFSYIENNFDENDILISLFADHGQGYLVPDGHHFLSKERTKVAFMFRGNNVPCQFTDELISTADYLPIMCKLSGIDYNKEIIDGSLPEVFGGEKRKEYVITESLHPGDIYSAVANTSDYEIYFDNSEKTDDEGRFILENYKVYGYDRDGKEIKDDAVLKKYERIFLDRIAERIIYE